MCLRASKDVWGHACACACAYVLGSTPKRQEKVKEGYGVKEKNEERP